MSATFGQQLFLNKLWIRYQAALTLLVVVALHIIVWHFFQSSCGIFRTSPSTTSFPVLFFNAVYPHAQRPNKVVELPRHDAKQPGNAGVAFGRERRSKPGAAGMLTPHFLANNEAVQSFAASPTEPVVESTSQSGLSASAAEKIEWAIKNAGKIDRELRSGIAVSLPVSKSRFEKLSDDLSSAYISKDDEVDRRFVTPEGIIYYSTTIRGKTTCYMTGPVNSPSAISKGPSAISCPSNAGKWVKY
ncbi:hypothetical protein GCM43_21875 [Janthinobacterium aquaticum]|nr:hypothetical protein GCM43_21875 [Janthinobacterium sp. FT58W]